MFSRVLLFVTPWTVARQPPLSVGFLREEYSSGLPTPGDLPHRGIEPNSFVSPAQTGGFLPLLPLGSSVGGKVVVNV